MPLFSAENRNQEIASKQEVIPVFYFTKEGASLHN